MTMHSNSKRAKCLLRNFNMPYNSKTTITTKRYHLKKQMPHLNCIAIIKCNCISEWVSEPCHIIDYYYAPLLLWCINVCVCTVQCMWFLLICAEMVRKYFISDFVWHRSTSTHTHKHTHTIAVCIVRMSLLAHPVAAGSTADVLSIAPLAI